VTDRKCGKVGESGGKCVVILPLYGPQE